LSWPDACDPLPGARGSPGDHIKVKLLGVLAHVAGDGFEPSQRILDHIAGQRCGIIGTEAKARQCTLEHAAVGQDNRLAVRHLCEPRMGLVSELGYVRIKDRGWPEASRRLDRFAYRPYSKLVV
jgi:hypothetical protein